LEYLTLIKTNPGLLFIRVLEAMLIESLFAPV